MCRLFGLLANKLVGVGFSFFVAHRSFSQQSMRNPDGWGVAWLDKNGEWRLFKETLPLAESDRVHEVIGKAVRGRIIVAHVRLATTGELREENTHPWVYRGWVFAHNGVVDRRRLLSLIDRRYQDFEGDTDSEALFHLVVQEVEAQGDPVEGIKSAVEKILEAGVDFSSLNFIASDGRRLYALRYATTNLEYYTLYYLRRPNLNRPLEHRSKETRILIKMKLAMGERAVLVASEPLTRDEEWILLDNQSLLVVEPDLTVSRVNIH